MMRSRLVLMLTLHDSLSLFIHSSLPLSIRSSLLLQIWTEEEEGFLMGMLAVQNGALNDTEQSVHPQKVIEKREETLAAVQKNPTQLVEGTGTD